MDHQRHNVSIPLPLTETSNLILASDLSAPPQKQAEQIMAIYPIVDGQKLDQRNVIPPHNHGIHVNGQPSKTDQSKTLDQTPAPQPAPPKEPEATADLIDFSEPVKKKSEIENMLSSTGKPADGPLIDFTTEMKQDLPSHTH